MLLAFTALNLYQTLIFSARLYELLFLEFCKRHLYVKVYMLYVLDCKVVIRTAEGNVRQFEEGAITGVRWTSSNRRRYDT